MAKRLFPGHRRRENELKSRAMMPDKHRLLGRTYRHSVRRPVTGVLQVEKRENNFVDSRVAFSHQTAIA
jgi:hypothetical protein